jgi:hypothetical protein
MPVPFKANNSTELTINEKGPDNRIALLKGVLLSSNCIIAASIK